MRVQRGTSPLPLLHTFSLSYLPLASHAELTYLGYNLVN